MVVLNVRVSSVFATTISRCFMFPASPRPGGRTLKLIGGSNHLPKASQMQAFLVPLHRLHHLVGTSYILYPTADLPAQKYECCKITSKTGSRKFPVVLL